MIDFGESKTLEGPNGLTLKCHPAATRRCPELHCEGVTEQYGTAKLNGFMLIGLKIRRFTVEELDWLDAVENQVRDANAIPIEKLPTATIAA
jgi:hypothetical protein